MSGKLWLCHQFTVENNDNEFEIDIQQDFIDNSEAGGVVRLNIVQVPLLIELLQLALED